MSKEKRTRDEAPQNDIISHEGNRLKKKVKTQQTNLQTLWCAWISEDQQTRQGDDSDETAGEENIFSPPELA